MIREWRAKLNGGLVRWTKCFCMVGGHPSAEDRRDDAGKDVLSWYSDSGLKGLDGCPRVWSLLRAVMQSKSKSSLPRWTWLRQTYSMWPSPSPSCWNPLYSASGTVSHTVSDARPAVSVPHLIASGARPSISDARPVLVMQIKILARYVLQL